MNDLLQDLNFWAGTEDSLAAYLLAVSRITPEMVAEAEKRAYGGMSSDVERAPRLFSKQGSVAVISIAGPLNNRDSWMNAYMGYVGYPEIREAMIHAAKDPDVKAVVLDIKSGGGAVSGVSATGELISMIDKKVKPVYAYSDAMIASAAYWLGSSARKLSVDKVAEIGSIGVLMVHKEMSKYLEKEGITATVMRAGKYKAMGNSYEVLTDTAREQIQGQLDQMYQMFVEHVADARGVTYSVADSKMAQGRMFIGQSAVDAGLVDAVTSFDAFMGDIQRGIDNKKAPAKYGANQSEGSTVKHALTEQQIAALAAGGVIADAGAPEKTAEEIAAEAAAAEAAAAAAAAEAAAAVVAETTPAVAAVPSGNDAVVAMLQTQLAAANASVVDLTVKLTAANTAAETTKALIEKMRPVVAASVGNMRVAFGGTRAGADTLNDEALLSEYSSLSAQFQEKFKAGGVSGSPAAAADKGAKSNGAQSSLHKARLDATRR